MLYSILKMIVDVVTTILGGAFLLRFWIQIVRARPPFQIANFLIQLTDWFIRPLRKTIPGWAGDDWATQVGAIMMAVGADVCETWLGV